MQNFAAQCLDMARSLLGHNLEAINPDGTIKPLEGEIDRPDVPGHAALAIGEYYRATGETTLGTHDLVDLAARCITAQAFIEEERENGLAYAALGLLSFGPAKDRNPVWERLLEPTRERLDKRLLMRTDYENHFQAFNIAKSVARFSMGLSKKDETGKLIERFLERITEKSSAGFHDDATAGSGFGGVFDLYGVMSFVFIRQALQLHANIHLRERKLPSLRTNAEKYLRLLPDMVRQDGLGWIYGRGLGAYGQMHCISLILQCMRDGWIGEDQKPLYYDMLRRLFQYFFMTYLDQEHGYLVIRDAERDTMPGHTSRMADFDGTRYLCQWSRLAKSIGGVMSARPVPARTSGRWVIFDKSNRKEQGVFTYQDTESGLHIQLPLVGSNNAKTSDSLAFPHCPGIFDWPVNRYIPILMPELTFGENKIIPSFYGKSCVTGLGLRKAFYFRYEQPELINTEEKIIPGLGSVKVSWTFEGNKVTSDFIFTVKSLVTMDKMRYNLVIGAPHSRYRIGSTYKLGEHGLRCSVLKDDFHAVWQNTDDVSQDADFKTYYGKIYYVQTLARDHSLVMRPGQQYRLTVQYQPDIAFAE
ncbi:MAG: hypothetical protein SFY80_13965 [Verrucomicrobiota bacterium]|nr:hypothetical protein [Verrucomicrobiota bacterium]